MRTTSFIVLAFALSMGSLAQAEPSRLVDGKQLVVGQAAAQTMCPEVEKPVCAKKDGKRVRYGNECKAMRDGATDIKAGACEATK